MAQEIEGEGRGQDVNLQTHGQSTQTPEELAAATAKAKSDAEGGQGTGEHDGGDAGGDNGAGGDDEHKDDINPDTGQPFTAEEWRDKFRASAKGANDLLEAKKTLEADIAKVRADSDKTLQEKEKEIADLRALAEGKNPEGVSLLDLQKKYGEVASKLAISEENKMLDDFIASTKIAGADSFKETLRALSRSNPSLPIATLWDNNLKVAATAAAEAAKMRDTTRKGSASDSGRGASSREHTKDQVGNTGLSLEEFNRLPVAKRKELLDKAGA